MTEREYHQIVSALERDNVQSEFTKRRGGEGGYWISHLFVII